MRIASLIFSLLLSFDAYASTSHGTVTKIEQGPVYGSLVFITIQGSISDVPACWTNGTYNYVLDAGTPAGRNTLASVLFAKANGLAVTVSGFNTCSQYQGVEDLRYFRQDN